MGNRVIVTFLFFFSLSSRLTATVDTSQVVASTDRGRVELIPSLSAQAVSDDCRRQILFQNSKLAGMQAQYDPHLGTFRYLLESDAIPASPKLILPIYHGIGALRTSHGETSLRWARSLSYSKDRVRKEVVKQLAASGKTALPLVAETLDWPMSGNFVDGKSELFESRWGGAPQTVATLQAHHDRLRAYYRVDKVVPVGASAGPGIIGARSIQQTVDGLILLGPVIPGEKPGLPESIANYHKLAGKHFDPNWPAFHWATDVLKQMDWSLDDIPFIKPTLVLVGENDEEVPEKTLAWLREQAARYPYVEVHTIPGARHDVLTPYTLFNENREKVGLYDPTFAYTLIFDFLDRHFGQPPT